jgi:tetratricopeptide (TPR) repeat protein
LEKVLQLYEEHLPEQELDLLSRLCVFRFGAELDALQSIFLGEDKIAVSGTLAKATRPQLEADLDNLVRMHLVGKDPKGRFTIHPAIRDHFYRRFRDPAAVHQAVREHLVPLSKRPGIGLPTDKESLDLLEELVHHAIQAGSVKEAAEIYMGRMGGNDHLNTHLGEYTRTYRILSAFDQCPDKSGMYHCQRAFGRMDEALRWRPNNRYLLLLSGNLAQLSNDPNEITRNVARALRGEDVRIPDRAPDCPITSSMIHTYRGELIEAERAANLEIKKSQYEDDRVRSEFALSEVERRQGALDEAKARMNRASTWALNSGSQEHLCLMQLCRARVAIEEVHGETALGALDEGTHIARECGFGLWLIELLVERGRLMMAMKDYEQAEVSAQEAFELASSPECRFQYGESEARQLLKESFSAQGKTAQQ